MDRCIGIFAVAVTVAVALEASDAFAQSWPTRPLTLVVPFAAGGPSDVAGRIIAQRMSEVLGQQVVVDNPSGAGGTLGSSRVAKAVPDGYQFVIGNIGTHAWSQSLYKKPPYDSVADFLPLSLVVESPRAVIAPAHFPANSLPEFVTYIKANQANAKFGSAGAGSASHVSCILLNAALNVSITHVPYRGLGPAMQDLIAGRVRLYVRFSVDILATGRGQPSQSDCDYRPSTQRLVAKGTNSQGTGAQLRGKLLAGFVPSERHSGSRCAASHSGDQ